MTYDHILIDGRNLMYRAIFAGFSDDEFRKDYVVLFFRFLGYYTTKYKIVGGVHIFWDPPKETLWRRVIYPEYKEGRRNTRDGIDINEELRKSIGAARAILPHAGVRNYEKEKQEADDLIYAFCRVNCGQKLLIVSSDGDLAQLTYQFENVDVHNPGHKYNCIIPKPDLDPVELKSFEGDKSDNIKGYYRVGPKTALKLASDPMLRAEFFEKHGHKTYALNRALVDLSLCPYTLSNITYIYEVLAKKKEFNTKKIKEQIKECRVSGLTSEFDRSITPLRFVQK